MVGHKLEVNVHIVTASAAATQNIVSAVNRAGGMVTDTALFRNPHYHLATDTPETLDYERFAGVVDGLTQVVEDLVNGK